MSATATVTLTPTGGAIPSTLAPIIKGETGPAGPGVPAGGTTGQVLAKSSNTDHDAAWVAQTGGSGGGATNLAYTASPTGGTVTSDTGTDATLPLADATNAGLQSPAQYTKLAGIAAGATAVAVDAAPTNGSGNAVSSGGVFDALASKSDTGHTHTGIYDPAGTAASAVAAHAIAADPHGDRAFATSAVSTHAGATDPHGDRAFATAADAAILASANAHAESLVVGLVDDRGNYDASGNTYPAAGGSGTAGAVLKGDLWTVSIAGTLGGVAVTAGDLVRALTDAPGQTAGNWAVTENNLGYVAENAAHKGASGGYAGLTGFALQLKNTLGTITGLFSTAATTARSWVMPDKDGTVAMLSDISGTNSGTNTGDETGARIATINHAAATKTILVDADEITGQDSAASYGLIRATLANLWTYIKSKADAVYSPKAVTILLPAVNDEVTLFRAKSSMTITKLVGIGGTLTYTVRKASDRSATGTEVVTGGSSVTSTTTGDAVTSFNSASIAAGDYVWLKLTAVTGTPASFNLTVEF